MKTKLSIIILGLFLSSCTMLGEPMTYDEKPVVKTCAEPRINASFQFHQQAKNFLSSFYKTRKESELFFAWYASEDSMYMAKTLKKCWDKKNKHYHAAQNVVERNLILRKLIVQNMRMDHQTDLSELFLEDYREIFVRDIQ